MASSSSPDDRKAKFRKLSPIKPSGNSSDYLAYFSDTTWNWREREQDKNVAADPKGIARYELIFMKEAPTNLSTMVEAANNISPFIECEAKQRTLKSTGDVKDCLTFHVFTTQGYAQILQFLRDGGIRALPEIGWMNEFKTFAQRPATMTIVPGPSFQITVKALAATVSSPSGRGIAQFLTGDPYNGLAIGRDVVINAPDKAKYDEFLLDLKALADEAGFTHRLGAMA